jgi:hypothetical protein
MSGVACLLMYLLLVFRVSVTQIIMAAAFYVWVRTLCGAPKVAEVVGLRWLLLQGSGSTLNPKYKGKDNSRFLRDDKKGQATAKARARQRKSNGEIRGSVRLRCSQNAVNNFAQDDVGFWRRVEKTGNRKSNGNAKAKATAEAMAKQRRWQRRDSSLRSR